MDLPSAGMIRFRFNGSACASQPGGICSKYPSAPRGDGEHNRIRAGRKGMQRQGPCARKFFTPGEDCLMGKG
jgi:hypothetical protein